VVRPLATAFGIVALALGCVLLGLTLETVFQHNRLAEDLVSLREETSLLKGRQQESLDKMEQALAQFIAAEDKVEERLQAVTDGQGKLESKVGALEAGQAAEAARWQGDLSGIEKTTREGLAGIASRLDSEEALAASVERLLPLLQPTHSTGSVQTSSETTPAP
jgi:Tfp pilus assembly protein PilN